MDPGEQIRQPEPDSAGDGQDKQHQDGAGGALPVPGGGEQAAKRPLQQGDQLPDPYHRMGKPAGVAKTEIQKKPQKNR